MSIYIWIPECSSESFSSLISLAHPSSRRMLFVACCSVCSNKTLKPSACGTCGLQLSVRSRLRKIVPSQNTRSVHCTRLPSSMHSRSRRTMWFARKWDDVETSWDTTLKYTHNMKKILLFLPGVTVWLAPVSARRCVSVDIVLIIISTSLVSVRTTPLRMTWSTTCCVPTTPHCWTCTTTVSDE